MHQIPLLSNYKSRSVTPFESRGVSPLPTYLADTRLRNLDIGLPACSDSYFTSDESSQRSAVPSGSLSDVSFDSRGFEPRLPYVGLNWAKILEQEFLDLQGAYKKLEEQNLILKTQYDTLTEAFNSLLRTIPGAIPKDNGETVVDKQPLKRDDYPNVKFWYKREWSESSGRVTDVGQPPLRGRSRAAKNINVAMKYVENENGESVDGDRASEMRKYARSIWSLLSKSKGAPQTWGQADVKTRSTYCQEMSRRFPELRLCDLDWKAEQIATDTYPSWCSYHRRCQQQPPVKEEADPHPKRQHEQAIMPSSKRLKVQEAEVTNAGAEHVVDMALNCSKAKGLITPTAQTSAPDLTASVPPDARESNAALVDDPLPIPPAIVLHQPSSPISMPVNHPRAQEVETNACLGADPSTEIGAPPDLDDFMATGRNETGMDDNTQPAAPALLSVPAAAIAVTSLTVPLQTKMPRLDSMAKKIKLFVSSCPSTSNTTSVALSPVTDTPATATPTPATNTSCSITAAANTNTKAQAQDMSTSAGAEDVSMGADAEAQDMATVPNAEDRDMTTVPNAEDQGMPTVPDAEAQDTLLTSLKAPSKKSAKMRPSNSKTPRNLCAIDWCEKYPKGTRAEFKDYFDALPQDVLKIYEDRAQVLSKGTKQGA